MVRFIAWFWMGLVAGVSFIATPVKFRATSLPMAVALDVGHVTLHALNRIEWFLAALCAWLVARAYRKGLLPKIAFGPFAAAVLLVVLQTTWLLPVLDVRTEMVIAGTPPPPSPLHAFFIAAEALKLVALGLLGWTAEKR